MPVIDRNLGNTPLAVVGMACRLPGADNLDAYWELLLEGKSGITRAPAERFDEELYYHPEPGQFGASYCRVGGFVEHRPEDLESCGIGPEFAARYDVIQLTLLEVAATACRDAGYDPFGLPVRNTGAYVGIFDGSDLSSKLAYATHARDLAELLHEVAAFEKLPPQVSAAVARELVESIRSQHPTALESPVESFAPNTAAAILAEAFDLSGPCLAIDGACASSLIALQSARDALHQGRIDMAIVAAASFRKWYELVMLSNISSIGTVATRPFDEAADGFIGSDGYAAVLLKTLARALADGDSVRGVIRGMGMSSDGRGKSFWAPRQEGQVLAIRRAYECGVDPSRLQYIEAHAASTQLGDATELLSINEALGSFVTGKLPVASVKANIGHTLETAGLAGLIKTLLAMRHGIIPPAINFETSNRKIDWDAVPFYVPTSAVEWPLPKDGHPRRAGVNSFGIGGLNMHVVVDGPPAQSPSWDYGPAAISPGNPQDDAVGCPPEPVAIVGMGCLFPGAHTIDAFWELVTSSRDAKSPVPPDRWDVRLWDQSAGTRAEDSSPPVGGFLRNWEFDWKTHKIPPKQLGCANPLQFMVLDAVAQALADADYNLRDFDKSKVGTVVGALFTNDFVCDAYLSVRLPEIRRLIAGSLRKHQVPDERIEEICAAYGSVLLKRRRASQDESGSGSSSTLASRITKAFDLMGGAFAIDVGDASSLAAVAAAVDLLQTGTCNMVICAAGQQSMDLFFYERLHREGRLSASRPRAAFDIHADGLVPGEGAGVVILKRLSDARRDGDRIRALVRGVAATTNATDAGEALRRAIELSLESTRTRIEEVGLFESTSPADDRHNSTVAQALTETFATSDDGMPILIGSMTAQIGHTGAAAGMASLIKATLALENGLMPATFGMSTALPVLAEHPDRFNPLRHSAVIHATTPSGCCVGGIAAVSESGFGPEGGTAFHLLLEGGTNLPSPTSPEEPESRGKREEKAQRHRGTKVGGDVSQCLGPLSLQDRDDSEHAIMNRAQARPSPGELEALLIDLVIEQTGFPREIVDLDCDFSTDLLWDAAAKSSFLDELRAGLQFHGIEFSDEKKPAECSTLRQLFEWLSDRVESLESRVESPESRVQRNNPKSGSRLSTLDSQLFSTQRTTARFVLRMSEEPLPDERSAATLGGPAVILGRNAAAEALRFSLEELGAKVFELPVDEPLDRILAELERIWQHEPAPHLFLMTARDDKASLTPDDEAGWNDRRVPGVVVPFCVCQRWFELVEKANVLEKATLVAATALGGDCGFRGHSRAVEGGAIAGLLKATSVETGGKLFVKVVDSPSREPAKLIARSILSELAAARPDVEVGYLRGRRSVVRAVPQPTNLLPPREVDEGTVWVVTGGARGITAVVARELGRRFRLKLHLVGTTPAAELDEELRAFEHAGVDATYHACDVSDRQALNTVLQHIRGTDGVVTGIIHGAGFEKTRRFTKKKQEDLARTLAGKVDGAAALIALTRGDPLKYFVAFGSIGGRFGAAGQTDYAAANEMLAKMVDALRQQRPECAAFTIHWPAWDDVGMSMRPKSRMTLKLMKTPFMPPAEGARNLIGELQAGSADSEILIVDSRDEYFSKRATMPTPEQQKLLLELQPLVSASPLIDDVCMPRPGDATCRATFDPRVDPFLPGHMYEGVPLLPAVIGIETCAEAAAIISGGRTVVSVRDLKLINGFRMSLSRPYSATVEVSLDGNDATCRLSGEFYDKQGRFVDSHRQYHSCIIELDDAPRPLTAPVWGDPPSDWQRVPYPDDWREMEGAGSGSVYYGPELRTLKEIHHLEDGTWGHLVAPPLDELGGSRRGKMWCTPAALIDGVLFSSDLFATHTLGTIQLPTGIASIQFGRMPRTGESCLGRAFYRGRKGRELLFDYWLIGDDGEAILYIEGCCVVDLTYSLSESVQSTRPKRKAPSTK